MKKLILTFVVIFATFNFIYAQHVGAPGGSIGFDTNAQAGLFAHRQAGTFGGFGVGDQWIGIGQPIPSAYGTRIQWANNAGILALTDAGGGKRNLELNWGGPGQTGRFEINRLTSFTNPAGKSNYLTILHDGRVGLGTHSPSYKLQAQGDIYANGGWLRVSGKKGLYFQTYGGGLYMTDHTWIRTAGSKSFYHNTGIMRTDGTFQVGGNGSRFLVNTAGHVGITQTAPKGPLHIGQQLVLSSPNTNGGWGGIAMNMYWSGSLKRVVSDQSADMTFTNGGDIIFRTAPYGSANTTISNVQHTMRVHNNRGVSVRTDYLASNVQFSVAGNLTATNHWNTSDGRFKKNVKSIDNALDKINALSGKSYQFKAKVGEYDFKAVKGKDQLGFIASELKEILPELVQEDDNGYQSVNYIGVIPVLVEAVKEQQGVLAEQEEVIRKQDSKIEILEERLAKIEAALGNGTINIDINRQNIQLDGEGTYLEQNQPNPFSNNTLIRYRVPAEAAAAAVNIYDAQGQLIHSERVTQMGVGEIQIKAGTIAAGIYSYTLVIDGNVVDTKRMVIAK